MEAAALIISFGVLVVSAFAAVAAVVQAKVAVAAKDAAEDARNEARLARDETVNLAKEAVAESRRQADAQEERNKIAREALPKPAVTWEIHEYKRYQWLVTNTGDALAEKALLYDASEGNPNPVSIVELEARDVGPGDALEFRHFKGGGGGTPKIGITWLDPQTGAEVRAVRQVR